VLIHGGKVHGFFPTPDEALDAIAKQNLGLIVPPLGAGLVSLPVLVTNLNEARDPRDLRLYDQPARAE